VSSIVYKAITRFGDSCHFGHGGTAAAWAGKGGRVEEITLADPSEELKVVPAPSLTHEEGIRLLQRYYAARRLHEEYFHAHVHSDDLNLATEACLKAMQVKP
jgi:hypothetical protein